MKLSAFIGCGMIAMEPAHFQTLMAELSAVDVKEHLTEFHSRPKVMTGDVGGGGSKPYDVVSGVATIPVNGVLTKNGAPSLRMPGMADISAVVKAAMNDPAVKAVMMTFYSPGGMLDGCADLAADVKRLANAKPTYAYIEDMCCSAAYWIASQCNKVYCNSTAHVGSIGVYRPMVDSSKAATSQGLEYVYISTGGVKTAGAEGAPIPDEHKAAVQENVNSVGKVFFSGVQSGRGFTDSQMSALTDGRVYIGAEARTAGLVDGVTSKERVFATLKSIKLAA